MLKMNKLYVWVLTLAGLLSGPSCLGSERTKLDNSTVKRLDLTRFMGKWYERTHNYVISPIQDWLDSLDSSILLMICASVIFSFGAALIIMILGWILKLCFKKKKS